MKVGDRVEIDVTGMAHGGEAVGRIDGRVVFVRGALPDERVAADITAAPQHGRFLRASVTDILLASPDRVSAPCPYAGHCGGCDWQHISLDAQRRLKADIVRDQMTRLAGEPADRWASLAVEPMPGAVDGLHWRTRMRYSVDADGRAGLYAHHAHDVVAIDACLIASPDIGGSEIFGRSWSGTREVLAVQPDGPAVILADPRPGAARVGERAAGREWTMDATAFWQVHVGAADVLVDVVTDMLMPQPGEHLLDLYAGVGLFAGALADTLGPGGRVDTVEDNAVAVRGARRSLHSLPTVHLHEDRVDRWLRTTGIRRCDMAVLDPPRAGAGRDVMERLFRLKPRAIVYVACDPSSLARDVGTARKAGWHLSQLRALDLFPMTHHVECVALFLPGANLTS
jgi:tRNA/tmRNA/rRNA uracil-C5-methylase (TrmA/RlmC/RlmD family)